jgi:hypothetical protein
VEIPAGTTCGTNRACYACLPFSARHVEVEQSRGSSILLYQQELARETAISLIGSTTTATRLKVIGQRDDAVYETAQSVSDEEYESIPLTQLAPFGS